MAETFKSNSAGDPTPLVRVYLVGGADYRKEWLWEIIDSNDVVVEEEKFETWWSVTGKAGGFTLKIGPTSTAAPTVTATDITHNTGGRLIVKVGASQTSTLQQAYTGTSDTSEWYGVLRGYDEIGDLRTMARAKVILQHMPL